MPAGRRGRAALVGLHRSEQSDLRADGLQLALPFDQTADAALDAVLDDVRDRFGPTALTRATLLTSHPRLATWLHPEEADEAAPQAPPNRHAG